MKTEHNTFNTMRPKMQVSYFTFKVLSLGDKYFSREITRNPEEIQKIFKSFANNKMEHVCSTIKDIEFCQCLDEFGIRYNCCGEKEFIVVVKVCSYMPIERDSIRTERLIEHYNMQYTY